MPLFVVLHKLKASEIWQVSVLTYVLNPPKKALTNRFEETLPPAHSGAVWIKCSRYGTKVLGEGLIYLQIVDRYRTSSCALVSSILITYFTYIHEFRCIVYFLDRTVFNATNNLSPHAFSNQPRTFTLVEGKRSGDRAMI